MRYLACALFLVACGGGSGEVEGDPIIQTTLMAQFDNKTWTPMFGFARTEGTRFGFYVGQQKISCADDFEGDPREGNYAAVGIPAPPMVGNQTGLVLNMIDVVGNDLAQNIVPGSMMVTAVNEMDVSATFAFDVTNTMGERSALNGAVTLLRCP